MDQKDNILLTTVITPDEGDGEREKFPRTWIFLVLIIFESFSLLL